MKKLITGFLTLSAALLFFRPTKVQAPRQRPDVFPGDLLFSPLGERDSFYIGHVGIVTEDGHVIHSIPKGVKKDGVDRYFNKFNHLTLYRPKNEQAGLQAAAYANRIYETNGQAPYRFFTTLEDKDGEQYCTKLVWQAYYFGAGVNLKNHSLMKKAIHPEFIKDRRFLSKVGSY
ncbi:YiiX/YebB-like N1pC/P60 family cysteine hydrolase [Salimicrobium sp. PL1-032A]|uniref:YiiX/YebB-like N1pC/P60 family cysteine hydrolase n=1 Tax=Salimicrobium sp. PL1-032A TaxID=3095364 RepID=UPI0032600071